MLKIDQLLLFSTTAFFIGHLSRSVSLFFCVLLPSLFSLSFFNLLLSFFSKFFNLFLYFFSPPPVSFERIFFLNFEFKFFSISNLKSLLLFFIISPRDKFLFVTWWFFIWVWNFWMNFKFFLIYIFPFFFSFGIG